jgi:hypothetical protein
MSSASKSNILPRVGESSTNATSGGDTTIFATDDTDQKFSHNKNDLIFYDVNKKNTLVNNTTGDPTINSTVFKVNNKINGFSPTKLDPNDDSNTNEYNYIENAINLATCGAWENTDESLCVAPWGSKTDTPYLVNFSKTPSAFRTQELMSNAKENLDKFEKSDAIDLTDNNSPSGETVSKQAYYNGMFYMINKYLLAKSRFYNSANKTSSSKPGFEQLIDIFTGNSDYNVNSFVKLFLFVVIILSIYLILRGLSTITSIKSKGEVNSKSLILFGVIWFIIIYISVLSKTSSIKNYYTLFTGQSYKLNEPCENAKQTKVSKIKYVVAVISVLVIMAFIKFSEFLMGENSNAFKYGINFALIIGFSIFIAFVSSPTFGNKSSNEFKMSYGVDNINELPFHNTYEESWYNGKFWIIIFIILIIVSLAKSIMGILNKNKSNNINSKSSEFTEPWLRLRGLFIIGFNLLLIYYVPFYLVMYPIICMLQRMAMGSLILPAILDKFKFGNKSFENMDSSQKLVLFNTFVGWDLPGWSIFKFLDVIEKVVTGGNPQDMLKADEGGNQQNTSNINVFTEFGKKNYVTSIFGIFYSLIPNLFYKYWSPAFGNNNNNGPGKFFIVILFVLVGLFSSFWFSSIIFTYISKKELDLSYPFPPNSGSKKAAVITYTIVYFITLVLLILKSLGIQSDKIGMIFNNKKAFETKEKNEPKESS